MCFRNTFKVDNLVHVCYTIRIGCIQDIPEEPFRGVTGIYTVAGVSYDTMTGVIFVRK